MSCRSKCVALLILCGFALAPLQSSHAQQKVIFDTDMAGDWDDAGAMATLHALADLGEAEILGMALSTGDYNSGSAGRWNHKTLDIINTYYNRPDIPIAKAPTSGINGIGANDEYGKFVVDEGFPFELNSTRNAVDMYRELLAGSPDNSVVLITVGYVMNIHNLLLSGPDQHSSLSGRDLIAQKVDFWSAMAGVFPGSGSEANMADWSRHSADYSIENFPRPILFTSKEAGNSIGTGASLLGTPGPNDPNPNPVRAIYQNRFDELNLSSFNHSSFDQLAVYNAIRDPTILSTLTEDGYNDVWQDSGNKTFNQWRSSPDQGHRYYTHKSTVNTAAAISALMGALPVVGLDGDFDGDGDVDGADFLFWQRDSSVEDLTDWESHYGEVASVSAAANAVPEPACGVLVLTSLLCLAGIRLRRR